MRMNAALALRSLLMERYVHDGAGTGRLHQRHDVLDTVRGSDEVHAQDPLPVRVGNVLYLAEDEGRRTHARILLMSDESRSDGGMKDADITSALGVGQSTVERIRKRCVEEGVESALNRQKATASSCQKRLDPPKVKHG